MVVSNKQKILLLASNSLQESNLNSGNELMVQSITDLGYEIDIYVFSNLYNLVDKIKSTEPDLVFNLFRNTSDDISTQMYIVGVLEMLRIPYIGHNPFVLGLSNMKNFVKRLLENKRISSIPYQIYREKPKSTYLKFPVFLRPANMDWPTARIREKKVMDFNILEKEVTNYLSQYKQPILVETLIPGRIFFVGIFGNMDAQILPVCEAIENKNTYEFKCPAKIDWETNYHLREIALHVYKYLMGKDYALISFLADKENQIFVADYHPNPSLLNDSIFQLAFKVSDYEFTDFLQLIINEALARNAYDKN